MLIILASITARKRSLFLHRFVCHSVYRGCVSQHAIGQGVCFQGCLPMGPGGVHPLGMHLPVHPPVEMTIETGGMHPTGMHSCLMYL